MAGVAPPKTVGVPTSTTQHLQGLLTRKTATAEPKSIAQYFNHVADAVRVNDELTALRTATLKRRWRVTTQGYEAVLNRKKRSSVSVSRPSLTGPAYLTRAAPVAIVASPSPSVAAAAAAAAANAAATSASAANEKATHPNLAAMAAAAAAAAAVAARNAAVKVAARPPVTTAPVAVAPAKPVLVQAAPKPAPIQPATVPSPLVKTSVAPVVSAPLAPAPVATVTPAQLHVPVSIAQQQQQTTQIAMPASVAPQPVAVAPTLQPQSVVAAVPVLPRRSDFVVGTRVMIRHTADLVACGARNLVGKTGRIVAVPQVYGQEVYSVYIDEHETMFQVPFNALVLISPPAPTPVPINMQHQPPPRSMHQLVPGGMISQAQPPQQSPVVTSVMPAATVAVTAPHSMRPTPSIEDIKLEHSYQLHRLMQQQYREIQVLQQQYAECRLVNPAALPSIQKELSKLRLVHLSQVQTLKGKQALDLLGK